MGLFRSCACRRALGGFALALGLLGLPGMGFAQHAAHQHGVVELELVLQGDALAISVNAPLESLLGFERAPRNDRERAAAKAVLATFADAGALFVLPAAAGCVAGKAELSAPALQGKAVLDHADLTAQYRWQCAAPAQLALIQQRLFERYKGVSRIVLQGLGPAGQFKRTLKRPQGEIRLSGH